MDRTVRTWEVGDMIGGGIERDLCVCLSCRKEMVVVIAGGQTIGKGFIFMDSTVQ